MNDMRSADDAKSVVGVAERGINLAALRAAADRQSRLGGLEEMPLRLLSPYQGFSEEQYQACKRIMQERFTEWLP